MNWTFYLSNGWYCKICVLCSSGFSRQMIWIQPIWLYLWFWRFGVLLRCSIFQSLAKWSRINSKFFMIIRFDANGICSHLKCSAVLSFSCWTFNNRPIFVAMEILYAHGELSKRHWTWFSTNFDQFISGTFFLFRFLFRLCTLDFHILWCWNKSMNRKFCWMLVKNKISETWWF